ncbi:1-acyl-sn-glycerol-3-phosphate acyltransferase [Psychromonas sp. B3M02]|uniref:1-acyl-sn-glycerol-3-phosphate acyltransferase n=1 Tax=unclassified Psychromonas TaxID=2614957 RepID=UPI000DEB05E1|nr:1-acyl-sn-glycerol-3-phosphate acyltransferase [Psychromonas sp. B3M02]RBW46635.1 1-acyl-sn-glycerol-3-phosphate acyltransferase [Psychromonas sp. B3M02]
MPTNIDKFSDIRPYNDQEIQPAIKRVINSEEFMDAILSFRFPKLSKCLGFVIKPLLRRYFLYKWGSIDSIDKMQKVVGVYMQHMIDSTTTKFTYSGLENLDPEQNYLFVSNHRDIAMDPSFVNWALFTENFHTVRIAIGDNLLSKPFVSDLMRMNKSFIVKRSVTGVREMMKSLSTLSDYISTSLKFDSSIWIAQKEGRAKDGFDKTDPAIIKMFYVNGKKQKIPFDEYIKSLNIVPVAVSYELDPCDQQKARELYELSESGEYNKGQFEDIESIVSGIIGQKGHVHVAFGQPLSGDFENAEQVAEEIDTQIYRNYYLHPSNLIAAQQDVDNLSAKDIAAFKARIQAIPPELQETVLKMYANPVGHFTS